LRYQLVMAQVISSSEWAWQRQSVWSKTADNLKKGPSRQRGWQLILTVAAAALALAGSQVKSVSFAAALGLAIALALALAGAGLLRGFWSADQVRRWTRARSVSEAIKTEMYLFLTGTGNYNCDDREVKLGAEVDRLEHEARDLQPYTTGVQAEEAGCPRYTTSTATWTYGCASPSSITITSPRQSSCGAGCGR
jgi:hypothetical protein